MPKDINLFKKKNSIYLKEISSKDQITQDSDGFLLNTKGNEKETRKIVDALKGKKKIIAIQGNNNIFNRRILETMKIHYLVSPEKEEKRDTLKQRDSGANHVTATIAAKNNISFVINTSELQLLNKNEKAKRLSRIIQNIKICRKAKCQIKIASLAITKEQIISSKDRIILLGTLGASTEQLRDSVKF